jgi:anti-anti-sigma factor
MIPSTLRSPPKVESSGDVTVVTCTGRAGGAENTVASHLHTGTDRFSGCELLLDFSGVDSVCGNELGILIRLHRKMVATGGRLTLFNLRTHVYEIFALTNLDTVLGICREHSPSS